MCPKSDSQCHRRYHKMNRSSCHQKQRSFHRTGALRSADTATKLLVGSRTTHRFRKKLASWNRRIDSLACIYRTRLLVGTLYSGRHMSRGRHRGCWCYWTSTESTTHCLRDTDTCWRCKAGTGTGLTLQSWVDKCRLDKLEEHWTLQDNSAQSDRFLRAERSH